MSRYRSGNQVSQDERVYGHNGAGDGADYGIYLKADGGCGSDGGAPVAKYSLGKDNKILRLQRAPGAQCAPPP